MLVVELWDFNCQLFFGAVELFTLTLPSLVSVMDFGSLWTIWGRCQLSVDLSVCLVSCVREGWHVLQKSFYSRCSLSWKTLEKRRRDGVGGGKRQKCVYVCACGGCIRSKDMSYFDIPTVPFWLRNFHFRGQSMSVTATLVLWPKQLIAGCDGTRQIFHFASLSVE